MRCTTPSLAAVLVAIGDLVDDVVVRLGAPIRRGTDTESRIERRRGGSAANVAAAAARLGRPARFVGQVGDDSIGRTLVDELSAEGVDTTFVRSDGSTGTIIVLVHADGERTMLTDRRTCLDLDEPSAAWLGGARVLHVPLYSLVGGALAATSMRSVEWAHERAIPVSVDLSSVALLDELGLDPLGDLLTSIRPSVLFANADEAASVDRLRDAGRTPTDATTVEKRGADPVVVRGADGSTAEVAPAERFDGVDTTGAGDAFAAGFLVATTADGEPCWRTDPWAAAEAGHAAAAALLRSH